MVLRAPLARAVVAFADNHGLSLPPAQDFTSLTGLGVTARIEGRDILVGRPQLLTDRGVDLAPLTESIGRLEQAGHTVIAIAADLAPVGVIALGDQLRTDAVEALAQLKGAGLTPVLVTGDNPRTAAIIAAQLGIDDVRAGVLPEDKAAIVREFQTGGARVAMVGDGINDAPALMQAGVGVAMGGGTDIAVESADVIIVRDAHGALAARDLSRFAYRRTRHNVALAFTFNGIGIPLATTGIVQPVWAMIAMAASVTAIFANSIGARPSLLFDAIGSVARRTSEATPGTSPPDVPFLSMESHDLLLPPPRLHRPERRVPRRRASCCWTSGWPRARRAEHWSLGWRRSRAGDVDVQSIPCDPASRRPRGGPPRRTDPGSRGLAAAGCAPATHLPTVPPVRQQSRHGAGSRSARQAQLRDAEPPRPSARLAWVRPLTLVAILVTAGVTAIIWGLPDAQEVRARIDGAARPRPPCSCCSTHW